MKNPAAVALGKRAVKMHPHLHTPERMKELSIKGVAARAANRKCNKDSERVCKKDGLKYMPGGVCPCWR